jgi:hypothetical protein
MLLWPNGLSFTHNVDDLYRLGSGLTLLALDLLSQQFVADVRPRCSIA